MTGTGVKAAVRPRIQVSPVAKGGGAPMKVSTIPVYFLPAYLSIKRTTLTSQRAAGSMKIRFDAKKSRRRHPSSHFAV